MKKRLFTYSFFALAGTTFPLFGQSGDPVELEGFISDEVPVEESILPTTRPFNSVYGTDRSILDTPRNVTIISREQLDAISIKTPRDFARLTSSSYTQSNFGAPTSPNLRGQEADLFVNGIRKGLTSNGNGLPINFNSVESVNIVKGPAGSVYGTSNYLGGYADLITKRAFFDKARGSVSMTAGSFDTYYWSADYSTPISEEVAFRFSYSGEESNGYYDLARKNTQALYATITYRPNDAYELFVAGEFFVANYTENWGMNRPTQDLIDHGLYIPNAQTDAEWAAYSVLLGNGTTRFNGVAGETAASAFGGAGFATFAPLDLANPVKLSRKTRLLSPGDDSHGKNFWAQAIQTFKLDEDSRIEHNSMFQWIDRETFSSYHYSELLRDNWSFDTRLQYVLEKDFFDLNTGLRYRYDRVWSVNHFFNEPVNFWDLTRDNDTFRVPDAGFATAPFIPGKGGRGILSEWYYGGTGAETKGYIAGPFAQLAVRPSDQFIIDLSAGIDFVSASDFHPVTGDRRLKDSMDLENYSGSVVYKATDRLSVYVTYGYSQSTPADTGGRFGVANFVRPQESELLELGAKASFLDNKLFVGAAVFDRDFVVTNQDNSRDPVDIKGFEVEFNYQPNKNFYATFGYSYMDAKRTAGFFASAYTADRAGETGGIFVTPTFPGPSNRNQKFDYPGTPEHQITSLLSYKWDNGFGVRANLVVTGPYNLGYSDMVLLRSGNNAIFGFLPADQDVFIVNSVRIPWQHEIDLTVFYEYESWEFKATIFNVTDEENWDAPNAGYGNGSVVAREPTRIEGTITYTF